MNANLTDPRGVVTDGRERCERNEMQLARPHEEVHRNYDTLTLDSRHCHNRVVLAS